MTPDKSALIREWFTYCPRTGLVRWKKTASNRVPAGSVAGQKKGKGYIYIRMGRVTFLGHQVAFVLMGKTVPANIDHRDLDGTNNRWRNLRPATSSQNSANRRVRCDSSTGLKGVSRRPCGRKFQARITVNRQQIILGDHATPEAAHAAYMAAAKKHFGEFAHG